MSSLGSVSAGGPTRPIGMRDQLGPWSKVTAEPGLNCLLPKGPFYLTVDLGGNGLPLPPASLVAICVPGPRYQEISPLHSCPGWADFGWGAALWAKAVNKGSTQPPPGPTLPVLRAVDLSVSAVSNTEMYIFARSPASRVFNINSVHRLTEL